MAERADDAREPNGGSTLVDRVTAQAAERADRVAEQAADRAARLREVFSRRPTVGPGPAAKAVAEDLSALLKAEVALARAEVTIGAKAKGLGVGLLLGAAVFGWLAFQGVWITIAFGLAAAGLPGWLAALIVTVVLLLVAGVLALLGKRKLATPVSVDTTKANVQEDVAWAKAHLPTKQAGR